MSLLKKMPNTKVLLQYTGIESIMLAPNSKLITINITFIVFIHMVLIMGCVCYNNKRLCIGDS
jgi:hypothetical protein